MHKQSVQQLKEFLSENLDQSKVPRVRCESCIAVLEQSSAHFSSVHPIFFLKKTRWVNHILGKEDGPVR